MDCKTHADFQPILDEITRSTGLPIALDRVNRWVVFLPSRVDSRVPVSIRYFGVFQDGSVKVRGLAARRRDPLPWIVTIQTTLIEHLAKVLDLDNLSEYLPGALDLLRRELAWLRSLSIPPEDLLVSARISRPLEKYKSPSPIARGGRRLGKFGKNFDAGQCVPLVFIRGEERVWVWDQPVPFQREWIDIAEYASFSCGRPRMSFSRLAFRSRICTCAWRGMPRFSRCHLSKTKGEDCFRPRCFPYLLKPD